MRDLTILVQRNIRTVVGMLLYLRGICYEPRKSTHPVTRADRRGTNSRGELSCRLSETSYTVIDVVLPCNVARFLRPRLLPPHSVSKACVNDYLFDGAFIDLFVMTDRFWYALSTASEPAWTMELPNTKTSVLASPRRHHKGKKMYNG